ncbi:MAG TPA: FAD-dependent oxidoreductase [Actinomycetota bacterium]|nr:FAD-dependent oxidoreductase [Actinomycetota bacterium]
MKDRARVVIVGGGVGGCSLAYHLAKLGLTDVVLLEKGELTSGSTWHAAGLCTQFNASLHLTKLLMDSLELYRSLEAETGQAVGLHEVGSIRLGTRGERIDEFRRAQGRARVAGLPFELIGPERIRELCPLLSLDDVLGAAYLPTDGHVDPAGVTNAMARGAAALGVAIERRTRVTGLSPTAEGGWQVHTERGAIACEIVVNAAGMWAPEVGRLAGVSLPIVPLQHEFIVTDRIEALDDLPGEIPVVRDSDRSFYVRAEGEGLIVGPFEPQPRAWAVQGIPEGFEQRLLEPDLDRLEGVLELATDRIPALAEVGIMRVVNGPDGYTPDGGCLMGWVPGVRNLFVLAGFSIFGIVFGGGAGRYAAEWIVDGQPSEDMWDVDVRRFGPYAAAAPFLVARALDVYAREYAIHFPHEEHAAGRPVKTDPLYERLGERGAVFGFRFGWERPLWFAPPGTEPREEPTFRRPNWFEHVGRECRAVREGVGVLDQTSFGTYEVRGPGASALLDHLCANVLPGRDGRIVVTQMLTERGGIECDLTVTRLGPDRYYVVSAAATEIHDLAWIERHLPGDGTVTLENVTDRTGVLTVAGPRSRELLQVLTSEDLTNEAFPYMTARTIRFGSVPVLAMRLSYVGELGWELHHPIEHLAELYDRLVEAGRDLGLVDFGYRALDSLRMEKGYRLWGVDISPDRTPLEAGLERFVRLDKGDFIGRQALLRQREEGLRQTLACLTIDVEDAIPHGAEPILADDALVGHVAAAEHGHVVGATIALGYLPVDAARPGTELSVQILGRCRAATVVTAPLFDPENARLHS